MALILILASSLFLLINVNFVESCGVNEINILNCIKAPCPEKCVCIEGYERRNGLCVPLSCGKFEKNTINCIKAPCPVLCVCIDGYERCNGECVPKGTVCNVISPIQRVCGKFEENISACTKDPCLVVCVCIAGYERCNGVCVPEGTPCKVDIHDCGPNGYWEQINCLVYPCPGSPGSCVCNKGYENCSGKCVLQGTCRQIGY